jgi:hypothetical protein
MVQVIRRQEGCGLGRGRAASSRPAAWRFPRTCQDETAQGCGDAAPRSRSRRLASGVEVAARLLGREQARRRGDGSDTPLAMENWVSASSFNMMTAWAGAWVACTSSASCTLAAAALVLATRALAASLRAACFLVSAARCSGVISFFSFSKAAPAVAGEGSGVPAATVVSIAT